MQPVISKSSENRFDSVKKVQKVERVFRPCEAHVGLLNSTYHRLYLPTDIKRQYIPLAVLSFLRHQLYRGLGSSSEHTRPWVVRNSVSVCRNLCSPRWRPGWEEGWVAWLKFGQGENLYQMLVWQDLCIFFTWESKPDKLFFSASLHFTWGSSSSSHIPGNLSRSAVLRGSSLPM